MACVRPHNSISNVVVFSMIHDNKKKGKENEAYVCLCICLYVCRHTCQHPEDGEASLRRAASLSPSPLSLSSLSQSLSLCLFPCVVCDCVVVVVVELIQNYFSDAQYCAGLDEFFTMSCCCWFQSCWHVSLVTV